MQLFPKWKQLKKEKQMAKKKEEHKQSEFIIFKTEDESISVDVRFEDETLWLTQDQIAALFGVERPGITQHIKNIFAEAELQENSVSKKFLRTAADGKNYDTKHYNLDMVISLGYRVNSKIATQFRIWATKRLNEYIRKGFTMDDERLKNLGGGGYWKELLQGAGSVSHDKAIEKATSEYKKYQAKTLSEAEKNYLESLKMIEKNAKKKK